VRQPHLRQHIYVISEGTLRGVRGVDLVNVIEQGYVDS
jgi:hypothetical protein